MSYDGKILRRALVRFDEAKQRRAGEYARRRREVYAQDDRIREIDAELRGTMSKIIASALAKGTDPVPAIRVLRDENLDLQRQRAELLVGLGYPMDYLEERPGCPLCDDTGYRGGEMCACLRKYYTAEQNRELSSLLDLQGQSFERFDFSWYSAAVDAEVGVSPREQMEENFDVCQDYARQFGKYSDNLLLYGDSGLGKTYLSACIAGVVSDSGHSVVYDTAGHIFAQMESAKFRPEEGGAESVGRYTGCDLLILDDLGTEMTTAFVQSALYQLINGRLMAGKKTVISTNLDPEEIGRRYSPQILSRIQGEYRILPFFGEDIRRLKRERM